MQLSEEEWKQRLTPEQYKILRERGTEPPYSGKFINHDADGSYYCAACGNELFESGAKFESTLPGLMGWPAFDEVKNSDAIELKLDNDLGMERTEVVCKKCGGHLGHYFSDPTSKTNKHYCINSASLSFDKPNEAV